MIETNAFAVSYGLIVITKDRKIVIIQRKIPYCIQDFLMKNKSYNINNYKDAFIKNSFPSLNLNMKFDYFRFVCGSEFEDQFDLPHGQMKLNISTLKRFIRLTNNNFNKNCFKYHAFMTAFREFKEETGFSFKLNEKIADLPTRIIEFRGLDNFLYKQIYFIITVNKLEKCKDIKVDNFYESIIIDITKALELFKNQQKIKCDGKDKILSQLIQKNCIL